MLRVRPPLAPVAGLLVLAFVAALAAAAPERVVSLSRSACFGACPVYAVTLYDDGTLVYEGEQFVKVMGRKTKTVDRATIARVKKAIEDSGIQKLDAHCCDCHDMTDHPSAVIGFSSGGQWKTLTDYLGCGKTPRAVRELEETLDTLLGTLEFIGALEERRSHSPR